MWVTGHAKPLSAVCAEACSASKLICDATVDRLEGGVFPYNCWVTVFWWGFEVSGVAWKTAMTALTVGVSPMPLQVMCCVCMFEGLGVWHGQFPLWMVDNNLPVVVLVRWVYARNLICLQEGARQYTNLCVRLFVHLRTVSICRSGACWNMRVCALFEGGVCVCVVCSYVHICVCVWMCAHVCAHVCMCLSVQKRKDTVSRRCCVLDEQFLSQEGFVKVLAMARASLGWCLFA